MVRTQGFHPCNMGSIPVGASNGSFVQWFSISDCLSEDKGSIPLWTAMKVNIKM